MTATLPWRSWPSCGTTFFVSTRFSAQRGKQTPCSKEYRAFSTQAWEPPHTPQSALPWPHAVLSAMNSSDSRLGAHSVSADRFKPERKEPYRESWAGAIYSLHLHHPHSQEMEIYWPLGPDPTRCWAPYGKHRATSFRTPPKKSAVFNFNFSMKNTAGIID